jgi:hypothetical protein
LGKIDTSGICSKLEAQVAAKEARPFSNDVVQDEESEGFGDESDFFLGQGKDLVIRREKREELRLVEGVGRIRPLRSVSGLGRHPGQEIEVENAGLEPEPVVVPSRKQPEHLLIGIRELHGEISEVPVDQDGDPMP